LALTTFVKRSNPFSIVVAQDGQSIPCILNSIFSFVCVKSLTGSVVSSVVLQHASGSAFALLGVICIIDTSPFVVLYDFYSVLTLHLYIILVSVLDLH